MRIFWQDTMRLGLATMDDEHRHVVGLLDGVCVALQRRNLPAAAVAVDHFSQVLADHFASEELLLEQCGGEEADLHRAGHRQTTGLVTQLGAAVQGGGDLAKAEELASELVTHWISRLFREDNDLVIGLSRRASVGK